MVKKKYALYLIEGGHVIKKLLLDDDIYKIGRADDTDLVLASNSVSRHHAMIHKERERYVIEDLNSTNGTLVNGQRISKKILKPGDEISIGDYCVIFDEVLTKLSFVEETGVSRTGKETAVIKDRFSFLRSKIKNKKLRAEFKDIEAIIRRSRKRLSDLANADKLTGLYNRQYFAKVILNEFEKAKTSDSSVSILYIDIDHFKNINDTYGHDVGDETLKIIAWLVLSSCRKTDVVVRYGGEEIVVILPNTNSDDAEKIGEEVRGIIASETVKFLRKKVTVSIGVAAFPDDGDSVKTVIKKADKALYKAKKTGRNRTCRADG